jgi:hypothetical protein
MTPTKSSAGARRGYLNAPMRVPRIDGTLKLNPALYPNTSSTWLRMVA